MHFPRVGSAIGKLTRAKPRIAGPGCGERKGWIMTALLERVAKPRAFSVFEQMRDEMDRMFEGYPFGRLAPWKEMSFAPAIEVVEKEGALFVKADLPGLRKEDVKVEVRGEGLTIAGERKEEKEEKKAGYFRTERLYGSFERFVPLPERALLDKAEANFKDGVLEVKVPLGRIETPEPKRLPIT
jgi:HSP20 family protein